MDINIILFDDFETLDVFGPVEIFGRLPEEYTLNYFSRDGGIITSRQNVKVVTKEWKEASGDGILFLPGGQGTRKVIQDNAYVRKLKEMAEQAIYCITVCTGSALLAATGTLKGKKATSNKIAFSWVKSVDKEVEWIPKARWVVDGKFYTSSGVSAGMDMALGFIADRHGVRKADEIATVIEYIWNRDKEKDAFAYLGE